MNRADQEAELYRAGWRSRPTMVSGVEFWTHSQYGFIIHTFEGAWEKYQESMKPNLVSVTRTEDIRWSLEGTLDNVCDFLLKKQRELGELSAVAHLSLNAVPDYTGHTVEAKLYWDEPETLEEQAERIQKEKRDTLATEREERAEYERLREKFEGIPATVFPEPQTFHRPIRRERGSSKTFLSQLEENQEKINGTRD